MSRGPDAATLLDRALIAAASRAGCPATIDSSDWTRWSSATFVGARHEIALAVPAGQAGDAWLARLPDLDFTLRGHIVADLHVAAARSGRDHTIARIEVLTVEDR